MLIRYLTVCLLTLSLSYGDSAMGCFDCLIQRASIKDLSCEDKISTILSVVEPEITDETDKKQITDGTDKERTNSEARDSKFEAMDKKLNVLVDKLNAMEKKNHDLEDIIHKNFHNLEMNIFSKLEEYIGHKFDASEKHFNERMEAHEKILSDKIDTIAVNKKLDTLNKIKPELNGSIMNDTKALENKTSEQLRQDYNQIIDTMEKLATDVQEMITRIMTLEAKQKTCTDLKGNLNHQLSEFKNMIPDMAEDIKLKLTELNGKLPENLHQNINNKLEKMEKNILDSKENETRHWDLLYNKLAQNIEIKLDEIEKKIPKLQSNMDKRFDALEDLENSVLTKIKNTTEYWRCKEQVVSGYNYIFYRMDNETLNHVTYKNNSDGLVFYEMHIAIKAVSDGLIQLASVPFPQKDDAGFEIAIGSSENQCSAIRHPENDYDYVNNDTPDILTPTEFISFYIKIDNGKLEVRKGQQLILKMSSNQMSTIKYFSFSSWYDHYATFLYDCPLDHEDEEGHGIR